jgi:hypothetical protein
MAPAKEPAKADFQIAQLPGSIAPWELRGLTDGQVDILPQTYREMEKPIKEGAENAADFYMDAAGKMYNDFNPGNPPPSLIMQAVKRPVWFLPLMLKGSTKTEEPNEK